VAEEDPGADVPPVGPATAGAEGERGVGEAVDCAGGTVAGGPGGRTLGVPVVLPLPGLPAAEASFVAWTGGCDRGCCCDELAAATTFLGWL
jgi:hypothetical protein